MRAESKFRAASAVVALLALGASSLAACSDDAPSRRELTLVGHDGRWMTEPDGRVLIVHGMNMVNKRPPYLPAAFGFDDEDGEFLADNGFTAVRLGVIWKGVEPRPGEYDEDYIEGLDETVEMLATHGIHTLIDFHQDALNERFQGEGFPDWAVAEVKDPGDAQPFDSEPYQRSLDRFWSNADGPGGVGLQDRFAAAYRRVADHFADDDSVLGYDIFNEPYGATAHSDCHVDLFDPKVPEGGFDCQDFDRLIGEFQQRVIDEIREVDDRHLVFYEPNTLFNWAVPTELPKLTGGDLGMSFHDYCPPGTTLGYTCDQSLEKVLDNADERSAATGDALLLTEVGNTDGVVLDTFADLADASMTSWMFWSYCGCDNPTVIGVSAHLDDFAVDLGKPPGEDNLVPEKVDAMVRPYPTLVAGTPVEYGFDRATKTFTFTYRPERVDGKGRFDEEACTEVFVPRRHYPHGYRVEVVGGEVVSDAGAGTLALRAESSAAEVRVTVTAGSGGDTSLPRPVDGCGSASTATP
ncbi:cellulase family glycosylhydrolase [soil metagenome]